RVDERVQRDLGFEVGVGVVVRPGPGPRLEADHLSGCLIGAAVLRCASVLARLIGAAVLRCASVLARLIGAAVLRCASVLARLIGAAVLRCASVLAHATKVEPHPGPGDTVRRCASTGWRRRRCWPSWTAAERAPPAYAKAAHYLGMEVVRVPLDGGGRADVDAARARLSPATAVVVASAFNYPYGVMDPVVELAGLAAEHGAGCHVDACIGGF